VSAYIYLEGGASGLNSEADTRQQGLQECLR